MNKQISVVIRNKNEAAALEKVLAILRQLYSSDIKEIIVVDNKSSDNSLEIINQYKCKLISIDNFTYGRAINYGLEAATSNYVLLLSSHAIPIGKSFFKNSLQAMEGSKSTSGIRYINSMENYKRALNNNFLVKDPLKFGLNAGCCLIKREVWEIFKFNEDLIANEDKEWSFRVVEAGFKILDLNETYFYFIKRNRKAQIKRLEMETIAEHQLMEKKYPSPLHSTASFFKKIIFSNTFKFLITLFEDIQVLNSKIRIYLAIRRKRNNVQKFN